MFQMFRQWWRSPLRFRLLPRRLYSHYRDADGILIFMTWWQWGHWTFQVIQRRYPGVFSTTWDQICRAADRGDFNSKLIRRCIGVISTDTQFSNLSICEVYQTIVDRIDK